jgi:hypothetical protein
MMGKNVLCIMIDEGDSNFIISISCWKYLDSLKLDMYKTMLKSFNEHMFHPHGIITAFPIELSGKIVFVVMDVVDASLEYNLLLVCTWFYEMTAIFSSVFRVLHLPHQGKIVTINQLVLCTLDLGSNAGYKMLFVGDSQKSYMSVGARFSKDLLSWEHFLFPHHLFLQTLLQSI